MVSAATHVAPAFPASWCADPGAPYGAREEEADMLTLAIILGLWLVAGEEQS